MDDRDSLTIALQALTDDQLARLGRSMHYRATQSHHQSGQAHWHRTLHYLAIGERVRRDGQIKPLRDASSRLRTAAQLLSERELVLLMAGYRRDIADFENHCGGAPMRLLQATLSILLDEIAARDRLALPLIDLHTDAIAEAHPS